MCGIVGYIGKREAYPIILNGLKRLEYRGYDSAGVALYDGTEIQLCKTQGKVSDLEEKVTSNISTKGSLGIGHTRWATHGVPNDVNSHPHYSNSGNLVIIHNGIIENYSSIKKALEKRGYEFESDTDTEVLINLIEEVKKEEGVKLGKAVQIALNQVVGAYAIAVFDKNKPDEIVVAKLGSPLAIGIGEDEFFIASDATPFIKFTKINKKIPMGNDIYIHASLRGLDCSPIIKSGILMEVYTSTFVFFRKPKWSVCSIRTSVIRYLSKYVTRKSSCQ